MAWTIWASTRVFGDTELGVRMPAVMLAAGLLLSACATPPADVAWSLVVDAMRSISSASWRETRPMSPSALPAASDSFETHSRRNAKTVPNGF